MVSVSSKRVAFRSLLLTNIVFRDNLGRKPWSDESSAPMRDFWDAKETWLPSWGEEKDRGMIVRSVKMWQEGKCSS